MSEEVEVQTEETEVQLQGIHNSSEDKASVMPPMSLHGRRQIFTNEEEVNARNVLSVLNAALPIHLRNRSEMVYLEKYVRGIQPILDRVKVYHNEICNKVVVNVANQIVTFKTAEFAGEPIQYISRGSRKSVPKKVEKLNSLMLAEGKPSKDMDLAYKMFTCGVAHRLILNDKALDVANGDLFDEAPFEIYTTDPRNSFVIKRNDVTKRVVAGVNYVFLDSTNSHVRYTVYTPNAVFTIEGSSLHASEITGAVVHNFGIVPLIEYPCNSLYMSPIEVVHDMLNALSLTQSDRLDGIEQFIQAIMVFEGVDISREDFLALKDLGAIKLPPTVDGKSSRVYYLNEQLDQSQTQTLVDDIYQTILQIVGMPSQGNANTSDSSNNGAVILKNGWWNAEARSLETAGMWKEAETQFLKIVLKICNEANVLSGLAVSDVETKFTKRSYEDLLTKTQSFSTLRSAGCPSLQAFKFSHLSQDPESDAADFDKYQDERAEELNSMTTIGGGAGDATGSGGVGDGEYEDGEDEASGGESSSKGYGVCPVCGQRFKKRSSTQVYDKDACRRIAQKQKSGGYR